MFQEQRNGESAYTDPYNTHKAHIPNTLLTVDSSTRTSPISITSITIIPASETNAEAGNKGSQAERIIGLLGGRDNIVLVDACMTRLRVTVKDVAKVAELADWKAEGALGLIKKGDGVQAVYGPKADVLKSDINDIL